MINELRVLVCGGRDYHNVEEFYEVLNWIDGADYFEWLGFSLWKTQQVDG